MYINYMDPAKSTSLKFPFLSNFFNCFAGQSYRVNHAQLLYSSALYYIYILPTKYQPIIQLTQPCSLAFNLYVEETFVGKLIWLKYRSTILKNQRACFKIQISINTDNFFFFKFHLLNFIIKYIGIFIKVISNFDLTANLVLFGLSI